MQTLYIDIYFLINFTVDLLALYFAVIFCSVPMGLPRLLAVAATGASLAVFLVFLPDAWYFGASLSILYIIIVFYAAGRTIGAFRRLKFTFAFYIFELLIGGVVEFLYRLLDKFVKNNISVSFPETGNRRLILLALVIILCVGILKLLIWFFTARVAEGMVSVEITFRGRVIKLDAFCDSGNLLKDPFDASPVMMVKSSAVSPLFPELAPDFFKASSQNWQNADYELKRYIRMIPIKRMGATQLLFGIKPERVRIILKDKYEAVGLTVAIDDEGGTYGGYQGLIPTAAISDAFR